MNDQSAPLVEISSGTLRGTIIEGVAAFKADPVCRAADRRASLPATARAGALARHPRCDGVRRARASGGIARGHPS